MQDLCVRNEDIMMQCSCCLGNYGSLHTYSLLNNIYIISNKNNVINDSGHQHFLCIYSVLYSVLIVQNITTSKPFSNSVTIDTQKIFCGAQDRTCYSLFAD